MRPFEPAHVPPLLLLLAVCTLADRFPDVCCIPLGHSLPRFHSGREAQLMSSTGRPLRARRRQMGRPFFRLLTRNWIRKKLPENFQMMRSGISWLYKQMIKGESS